MFQNLSLSIFYGVLKVPTQVFFFKAKWKFNEDYYQHNLYSSPSHNLEHQVLEKGLTLVLKNSNYNCVNNVGML
jgi:protein tyrosine/serine phosphatase